MSVDLRPYQCDMVKNIETAWLSSQNVLAVLATGAGKTVVFSHLIERSTCITVALAHRAELVGQMAMALARNGVRHRVIAAPGVRVEIEQQQMAELGRRFVDPHSRVVVASVQTFVNRPETWMQQCGLWVCDEAHHLLSDNVWGKAIAMLPNARGLGVTATPLRSDGKGLGRHADGVFNAMLVGPGMRDLTLQGFLAPYRVFAPPSDLDLSQVAVGASGEFVGSQLRQAVHRSHLTGDVVEHYLRLAPGKLGITFTVDIDSAEETAKAFRERGVTAEVLTGKTPTSWRAKVMRAFRAREILQIVNCDLLGEGTDVPAVEVVSFARPTASYLVYVQQFGRALRILEGKSHAIVIDHAGNVRRHGLPDAKRGWSLDRRERGARSGPIEGVIPVTTCTACASVYERIYPACPYCGIAPPIADRSAPKQVDGDLAELDESTLAKMRGEINAVDGPCYTPAGVSQIVHLAINKHHRLRQAAQGELRKTMAAYGGWRTAEGDPMQVAQRRFYLTHGVDVMTAQALGTSEANELRERVSRTIETRNGS